MNIMKDLNKDDLTTGRRQLADTDSADTTEYDPNLRNIMVDDLTTGRRPAKTIADLFAYRGVHSHMMVDSLTLGRIPLESVDVTSVWSPSALFASSEVGVWYDPSDLSTMFQNSNGTTAVAVGDPVGYIADKSGNGKHATQATAASRPILRQDGSGYYYLEFDGVDDSMATAAINFTGTKKINTLLGVYSDTYVAQSCLLELGAAYYSYLPAFLIRGAHTATNYFFVGLADSTGFVSFDATPINADGEPHVLNVAFDTSALTVGGKRPIHRVDTTSQSSADASALADGGAFINDSLYIGRRAGNSEPFKGRIYSMIVRGELPTVDEITDSEAYVNSKTGAF